MCQSNNWRYIDKQIHSSRSTSLQKYTFFCKKLEFKEKKNNIFTNLQTLPRLAFWFTLSCNDVRCKNKKNRVQLGGGGDCHWVAEL